MSDVKAVLEVGCGRGHCTLFLAGCAKDMMFHGIDMIPSHVRAASLAMARGGYDNATFACVNVLTVDQQSLMRTFDIIFGCESLCHMDTPDKRTRFFDFVCERLRPSGRLILIDGFRSPTYDVCAASRRTAMRSVERGFRIAHMPSKADWIRCATKYEPDPGLESVPGARPRFQPVRDVDLSHEALPYWERAGRWATRDPSIAVRRASPFASGTALSQCLDAGSPDACVRVRALRWYFRSRAHRSETGGSFMAAATVGHALRDRAAAEYGMLVLERTPTDRVATDPP